MHDQAKPMDRHLSSSHVAGAYALLALPPVRRLK